MTYNEFLADLTKLNSTGWVLYGLDKGIRVSFSVNGEFLGNADPITVLCSVHKGVVYMPMFWVEAAQKIGLDSEVAREIAFATDNLIGHNPSIRRDLLIATGIERSTPAA